MSNLTYTKSTVPTVHQRGSLRRFTLHYLEMVLAMVVGMVALGTLEALAFDALGWTGVTDRADVNAALMAVNMTVAMAGWMKYRGHGWAPIAEMSVGMCAPFLVLLVPLWFDLISEQTLMVVGHVLMLLGMLAAMLLRRDEYSGTHCG
jgi:hypothetical protein